MADLERALREATRSAKADDKARQETERSARATEQRLEAKLSGLEQQLIKARAKSSQLKRSFDTADEELRRMKATFHQTKRMAEMDRQDRLRFESSTAAAKRKVGVVYRATFMAFGAVAAGYACMVSIRLCPVLVSPTLWCAFFPSLHNRLLCPSTALTS